MSARLDGEDAGVERAAADRHLAGCAACRRWRDDAARIGRLARAGTLDAGHEAGAGAAVSDEILAAVPRPGRRRLALLLRGALGVLGAAQFLLGLAQVTGFSLAHAHGGAPGGTHLWHESAAWNVAVGAGFAWIALRRSRPSGLMPTLTAFVVVLALLSVNDLAASVVDPIRLLSHGFLLAGYVILLALSRRGLDPGAPPADRRDGEPPRWRARFDDQRAPARPVLRLLPGLPADGHARTGRAA